ncbi:MAG: SRPBCC domain-containing protein [Bacteroidetes bacterium]|nr:SRPBCC domain-containing protein [Bacteroidota bacterium]
MESKNAKELIITREFNAPKELVFKVFTEAKHLAHWWGPVGFKLEVITLDVRSGGKFHYSMTLENGTEMFGVFNYREVEVNEKLVFTNGFADKDGNVIRAPFSPLFPVEVLNTWTFTEKAGKTILTMKGTPYNATEEENDFFSAMKDNMNQGFNGTFNQLESYLLKLQS